MEQTRRQKTQSTKITRLQHCISRDMRAENNGHEGGVLWFTGLSGAGKSTLAMKLEQRLFRDGY